MCYSFLRTFVQFFYLVQYDSYFFRSCNAVSLCVYICDASDGGWERVLNILFEWICTVTTTSLKLCGFFELDSKRIKLQTWMV